MVTGLGASAQYNLPKQARVDDGKMTTQFVKTGLYVISGEGSNSVLRLSANGLILVDGKLPGNYEGLLKRVRRIVDQPVQAVILTNCGESRTGTNAKFLENGTHIIAQENARTNFAACHPSTDRTTPDITFDREYQLRLGGVEAKLMHFGSAYTSSDTVVYFANLKVVAVGDLFATTPSPDFSAGGSLVNWGPVLAQVLKLDFDVAVPSAGPPVTRAEVEAFKTKIDTLVARASALVKNGVPKDQLMTQLKTDDLGWTFAFTPDQVEHFYGELSQAARESVTPAVAGR
jgi:glyoxylase-like metal-dependent hydrolase (beta-lactamase superfamily II)